MNKKYQVFVSSTYKDLKEERMAVIRLLLKMGFIPVGMEQFPASNMSQMEYIKMMLDSCDYYLLILAGKYGSVDVDGIGFTEKEYDYAIANGIPVMSIQQNSLRPFHRLATFLLRQNCCAPDRNEFSSDFCFLRRRRAAALL